MALYRNQFLFADSLLARHRLAQAPRQTSGATVPTTELARLWQNFVPRPGKLYHTRTLWVEPVVKLLGHDLRPIRTAGLGREAPQAAAYQLGSAPDSGPRACMIAVPWGQNLDQPTWGQSPVQECGVNVAPAFRIYRLLRDTVLPWGIVTNGEEWRLYHAASAHRLDVYYAVNLPGLVKIIGRHSAAHTPEENASDYFYLFFRPAAFNMSSGWLDVLLEASRRHRNALDRILAERAVEALRFLAQGFLDYPGNSLQPDATTLRQLHDHSLVVLYWLLFVLYAESRGLLPAHPSAAYEASYSLHALVREIADDIRNERAAVPSMARYWDHVCRLWDALHIGNPDLGLPPNVAPLFNRQRYPFLTNRTIGDSCLRQAIHALSRLADDQATNTVTENYRDLDVRQLGSLYEQLLAYRLAVDPSSEKRLHLVSDDSARKRTGSYYTPDHVVDWLVEQSVGPILQAAEDRHVEAGPGGRQILRTSRSALRQELLDIKVLDPAAGSGHLLLAASDYIARHLTSLGLADSQELAGKAEITYWRQRVVRTCIYGVDLDPLAVELARLSLWTLTAGSGQPPTFLDHHLCCGNSLLGARMADVQFGAEFDHPVSAPQRTNHPSNQQLSMLDDPALAPTLRQAASLVAQLADTTDAVRSQGHVTSELYRERLRSATERYHRLADVWTARDFGLPVGAATWSQIVSQALGGSANHGDHSEIIERATELAHRFRFLHWELQFPEVFFDVSRRIGGRESKAHRSAGFDVVIGNPPYLFGEQIPDAHKGFLENHYRLAAGQYDLYWLFYERTLALLRPGGRHGFIVPDAILARDAAADLRHLLFAEYGLDAIALAGKVFDDPRVSSVLLACYRPHADACGGDEHTRRQTFDVWNYTGVQWTHARSLPVSAARDAPRHRLWVHLDPGALGVLTRLQRTGQPLRDFARLSRGEELGQRHLHPLSESRNNTVPVVIGADITPLHPLRPSRGLAARRVKKDSALYRAPKLVVAKTGAEIKCTIDGKGYVTLQSVYNVSPHTTCQLHPAYLAALLSSSLLSWYLQVTVTGYKRVFPQLNQSNLAALPVRPIAFTTPQPKRAAFAAIAQRLGAAYLTGQSDAAALECFVDQQLSAVPERADVLHDLLVWLAEFALKTNDRRLALRAQAEPFDYLEPATPCIPIGERFPTARPVRNAGEQLHEVFHDIDALRLVGPPGTDGWRLDARLKLRTPGSGWREWEYTASGHRIVRRWVPAAWLAIDGNEAAYYQFVLEHLAGFVHAGSPPTGHSTTTWEKLLAISVPEFSAPPDMRRLLILHRQTQRIAALAERARQLIDTLTCHLYGVTADDARELFRGDLVGREDRQ
jgi:hypothetical protein